MGESMVTEGSYEEETEQSFFSFQEDLGSGFEDTWRTEGGLDDDADWAGPPGLDYVDQDADTLAPAHMEEEPPLEPVEPTEEEACVAQLLHMLFSIWFAFRLNFGGTKV